MNPFKYQGQGRYIARLPKGETLRVLSSIDFTEEGNLFHVSASVGIGLITGSTRLPTDEEFKSVKELFPSYDFEEGENQGENIHVRHLWEKVK